MVSFIVHQGLISDSHTYTHTHACNDMIRVDLMRLWGNWKRAQQFHCHTHSRAHQYNHLQTLMTCEEAKVGGHRRAKDAEGTKEWRRRGGGRQTTKTQTKKTFRCFFYFLSCLVLVWSGLVRSSLFLTHTHMHVFVFCLFPCAKTGKKRRNCWTLEWFWDTYESFLCLSTGNPWAL